MDLRAQYEGKLRIAGFCSGIGMLETALETALGVRGVRASSVCHCEWESSTAAVLCRLEAKASSPTPIHGDMRTFDGYQLRGKVDGICAGLPCPSFSVAGKNGGNSDERAWGENFDPADTSTWGTQPHYLRLASEICPGFCIIEEVPQYFTAGHFAPVGEVLHEMDYTYQDAIIGTASSVGASHKRERVFILAVHRDYDFRARLGELGIELANSISDRERGGMFHGSDSQGCKAGECKDRACSPDKSRNGDDELANQRHEHVNEEQRQVRDESERSGIELANGNGKRCVKPGSELISGGVRLYNKELADSRGEGCEGDEWAGSFRQQDPTSSRSAPQCGEELGDSECERLQGGCNQEGHTTAEGTPDRCRTLPLHAPGIDGYMAWCATAVMDPSRMPSVEPGFSMVVDGASLAGVDLLRIGGNCVDALEATAFIGCLFDRWFASSGI